MELNLSYRISFPSLVEEGKRYPVIYVMHGRGSDETDLPQLIEQLGNKLIIISIRGPHKYYTGYSFFKVIAIGNPDVPSFDETVDKLEEFITDCGKRYPIDPNKQFLLGFSQGAMLSMTLVLRLGDTLKGIAALSGYIPKHVKENYEIKSLENVAIFLAHGEKDPLFPENVGIQNYEFFKPRAKLLTYKEYPIGHEVSREEQRDLVNWLNENL